MTAGDAPEEMATRARAWKHSAHAAVCDVIAPWAHGTVVRATRFPGYYDFNTVRVERDPGNDATALAAVADDELAGLKHRRLDVETLAVGERLRAEFVAMGWRTGRLVWMRHADPLPAGDDLPVEEVPYDAVRALRSAWHLEDFPEPDDDSHYAEAREVALLRNAQVFAVVEGDTPVAFAQLERDGEAAEVTQVYVRPDRRGHGRGAALTRAAVTAAGDVRDLWIVADDEDRPKLLYGRLGFRPAWTAMEFLRLPASTT